jgi:hypothetical protein
MEGDNLMAITDFATLKTAVSDWADVNDVSDEQLGEFVQMATAMFNYGFQNITALRVRQMEDVESLTPSSGVYTLPTDYLQYRRVVEEASIRRELTYITPDGVDEMYPDRSAGLSSHFTIIGSSLYTFPTSSNDLELTYYQKIPELTASATTNWLLLAHPMAYLHASLFHLGLFRRDSELQDRSLLMMASAVAGLVGTDEMANYAYAPGRPRGMTIA